MWLIALFDVLWIFLITNEMHDLWQLEFCSKVEATLFWVFFIISILSEQCQIPYERTVNSKMK